MIYIAIDDRGTIARKMVELIEEMPFATIYREFNATTKKAFKEIKEEKTVRAESVHDLLKKLRENNSHEVVII